MTETVSKAMGKCVAPPCMRAQKVWFISSLRWTSTELCVHDREAVVALHVIHFGYAQHGGENFRRDFHRTGLGRSARRRLRRGGGRGGVEGHIALDFFERLMNVPVKHSDRSEAFQVTQRLFGVLRAPTPLGINGPQRHMGK